MDNNVELAVDIELAGFNHKERMLLASLFKVSEMRPFMYRDWLKEKKVRPDCLLLDLDDETTSMRRDLEIIKPGGYPVIAIGKKLPTGLKVAAHIVRPIRWAEVLHLMDTALGVASLAPDSVSQQKSRGISDAENDLELDQIDAWYDRENPKIFKTDPAVLVIDPDPSGGEYITAKLAGTGYRVDHVKSGSEGLALLEKHRYNCVILEAHLPDKDGFEICKQIKQPHDRRRTASIILTNSRNPLDRIRASVAGCDAFLNKPIKPEKLLLTLEKFLPAWRKE